MAFNVARNNTLADLGAASPEAATYRPTYVREWLWWNRLRCMAFLLAAAGSGFAVAQ